MLLLCILFRKLYKNSSHIYQIIIKCPFGVILTMSGTLQQEHAKWLFDDCLKALFWWELIFFDPWVNLRRLFSFGWVHITQNVEMEYLPRMPHCDLTVSDQLSHFTEYRSVLVGHSILYKDVDMRSQYIRKLPLLFKKIMKGIEWHGNIFQITAQHVIG